MTINQVELHQEKPFHRAGFQGDRQTYIQEISRMRQDKDGDYQYHWPEPGQRIATVSGPFKVEKTTRVMVILHPEKRRRCYFQAEGYLVES